MRIRTYTNHSSWKFKHTNLDIRNRSCWNFKHTNWIRMCTPSLTFLFGFRALQKEGGGGKSTVNSGTKRLGIKKRTLFRTTKRFQAKCASTLDSSRLCNDLWFSHKLTPCWYWSKEGSWLLSKAPLPTYHASRTRLGFGERVQHSYIEATYTVLSHYFAKEHCLYEIPTLVYWQSRANTTERDNPLISLPRTLYIRDRMLDLIRPSSRNHETPLEAIRTSHPRRDLKYGSLNHFPPWDKSFKPVSSKTLEVPCRPRLWQVELRSTRYWPLALLLS